ncbi:MAG: hypothetical protein WCB79_01595 [Halobacteriota archaeon]
MQRTSVSTPVNLDVLITDKNQHRLRYLRCEVLTIDWITVLISAIAGIPGALVVILLYLIGIVL